MEQIFRRQAWSLHAGEFQKGISWVLDATKERLNEILDLVVCSEVLEHIPDDLAALRNIAQMTSKYLVVSTVQGRMRPFEVGEVGTCPQLC